VTVLFQVGHVGHGRISSPAWHRRPDKCGQVGVAGKGWALAPSTRKRTCVTRAGWRAGCRRWRAREHFSLDAGRVAGRKTAGEVDDCQLRAELLRESARRPGAGFAGQDYYALESASLGLAGWRRRSRSRQREQKDLGDGACAAGTGGRHRSGIESSSLPSTARARAPGRRQRQREKLVSREPSLSLPQAGLPVRRALFGSAGGAESCLR